MTDQERNDVLGHMFIVYAEDCKTPIAKGWIVDANEKAELIDSTCLDEETTIIRSYTTVVTGHITHYPL